MRIYQNFKEALPEIKRDLAEMGIKVHPQTYQDKFVGDNPDFETLELQNYIYTVVSPKLADLEPTQPWADKEWEERLMGTISYPVNPGDAWKERREIWKEFIGEDGKFAYTYSERLAKNRQVQQIEKRLKEDPDSRQLFISIWDVDDANKLGGVSRVPCSLGYLLQCRKDKLNITYLQRSADFVTHFVNDVYLAMKLLNDICYRNDFKPGTFTHWVGSLHLFNKDAKEVF